MATVARKASRAKTRKTRSDDAIIHLRPDQIQQRPEDNPRFNLDGVSAATAAKNYYASDDFNNVCASLDTTNGPVLPLVVERVGDEYRLIEGWSRREWGRRKQCANKTLTLPVVVRKVNSDVERLTLKVALNTGRRDYNPIAQAHAYARLLEGWGTVSAVSQHVGVHRNQVQARLNLLKLPVEAQSAIAQGKLGVTGAECLWKLPGFKDWAQLCDKHAPALTDAQCERAERFETAMKRILPKIAQRDKPATQKDVLDMWNDCESRNTRKRRKRIDPERVIVHLPTDDQVRQVCAEHGRTIAQELQKRTPRKGVIRQARIAIVHTGMVMAWCVPPAHVGLFTSRNGKPRYDEATAKVLCNDLVREFVLQGYLQQKIADGFKVRADDPIETDDGWCAFFRQQKKARDLMRELDKRMVKA